MGKTNQDQRRSLKKGVNSLSLQEEGKGNVWGEKKDSEEGRGGALRGEIGSVSAGTKSPRAGSSRKKMSKEKKSDR